MANQFEHIKPDEVYFLEYAIQKTILYMVDKKDYDNPKNQNIMSGEYETKALMVDSSKDTKWKATTGTSKSNSVGNKHNKYTFLSLSPEKFELFKRVWPELYKHFEDYYKKPQAPAVDKPKFSDNPEDYWFFSRGAGWEVVRKDIYRMAHRGASVICSRWLDGTHDTVKMGDHITHSFQDLVRTNDHKIVTLREQNSEQCSKYEAYYNKDKELDPSQFLIGMWTPSAYYCVPQHAVQSGTSATVPVLGFGVENLKSNWHDISRHGFAKFMIFEEVMKSGEIQRKLREANPSRFKVFEDYHNKILVREVLTPKQQEAQAYIKSYLQSGSDFDVDKQPSQNVASNRGKSIFDVTALQEQERKVIEYLGRPQNTGLLDIYKQPIKEGDFLSLKHPYGIGYDPYQKQSDLAMAMGMALNAQHQQNNSPKQINNENLRTEDKCLTRRKELTGSSFQSSGSEASITTGHFNDRPRPGSSPKTTGGSKISVSIQLGTACSSNQHS